jgi:hypothetical protein
MRNLIPQAIVLDTRAIVLEITIPRCGVLLIPVSPVLLVLTLLVPP